MSCGARLGQSFEAAFYTTAAFATGVSIAFAAFFACRLASTTMGLFGDLVAAEVEVSERRQRSARAAAVEIQLVRGPASPSGGAGQGT